MPHRTALLVASAATFLAYLDVTIVNVAFPDLLRDFPDASLGALSWTVSAYAIAFAALLAPAGRFADLAGRRGAFAAGMGLFAVASGLAALAPDIGWLIAARVVQGAGAAVMIPAALGIVLATAPPDRRVAAIGIWGAAGSLATAAGPTVGGLLVDALSWRAVFAVNIPLAAVAIVAALRGVPVIPASPGARRPDLAGTAAFVGALALLVGGLTQTGDWGWGDPATLGLLAGGGALLALAIGRAARHAAPAVEVRLFERREFALATLASAFAGTSLFAWLLFGVLFLTDVWGYSILETGLAVSPGAFTAVAASLVAGRLAQGGRGPQAIVAGGVLLATTAVGFLAALGTEPAYLAVWLPAGLLSGAGFGLLMTGVAATAAASLPPERFAAGTGLNLTARQVGGGLAIAVSASIVTASPEIGGFQAVFALCAVAAALAAATGAALVPSRVPAMEVAR